MDYRVIWTGPAWRDLKTAHDYIAQDSPNYASLFAQECYEGGQYLCLFPRRGRRVPELRGLDFREVFVGSYRLIYNVVGHRIYIVALLHGARYFWAAWGDR